MGVQYIGGISKVPHRNLSTSEDIIVYVEVYHEYIVGIACMIPMGDNMST